MSQPLMDEACIWNLASIGDRSRLEFTNLVRFREQWFCTFREADLHNPHPSARLRVLRSDDWTHWQSVATFTWDGCCLRDPHLSITSEGLLMINSSIVFGSMQQRSADEAGQIASGYVPREVEGELDFDQPVFVPHAAPPWRHNPAEPQGVMRQSVTWLSRDGVNWGDAHCCPSGVNTWRWSVTWHGGMGYSVARGKGGRDGGQLFRTRDGKSWQLLLAPLTGEGQRCNEASLAFDDRHTAWCVMRSHPDFAVLGSAAGPNYQDWQWRKLRVRTLAEPDRLFNADEKLGVQMGGPKLIRLSDGRLVAVGRTNAGGIRGEVTEYGAEGRIGVFEVDTEHAVLHEWAEIDARSYPSAFEHDGMLHLSFGRRNATEIWVARMRIPARS